MEEDERRGRGKVTAITKKALGRNGTKKVGRSKRSLRPREKSLVTATFAYSLEKEEGKGYFPFSSTVDGRGKKSRRSRGESQGNTGQKSGEKLKGFFSRNALPHDAVKLGDCDAWLLLLWRRAKFISQEGSEGSKKGGEA